MFTQLCKQHFTVTLFWQPFFRSKTNNHVVTYNHASADDNLRKSRENFNPEELRNNMLAGNNFTNNFNADVSVEFYNSKTISTAASVGEFINYY